MRRPLLLNAVLISIILSGSFSNLQADDEIVFTLPAEGSVFRVGEVMRIKFDIIDKSISWTPAVMIISADGFLNYGVFPMPLNGADTISTLMHYDWVVTASVTNIFTKQNVDVVGPTVQVGIIPYPGGGATARGYSKAFAILERSAVRQFLRAVPRCADSNRDAVIRPYFSCNQLISGSWFAVNGRCSQSQEAISIMCGMDLSAHNRETR